MPSATQRLRKQSRRAVGAETAATVAESVRSEAVFGNENLAERFKIRSVTTAQESYPPGADVTVTVEYGSDDPTIPTRFDIDTDHPDSCDYGGFGFTPGADLVESVSVRGGTSNTGDGGCWNGVNTDSIFESITVAAPFEQGTAEITAEILGRTSGTVYDSATKQISVSQQASEEEDRDEGTQNGNDDDDGLSDTTLLALGGAAFALVALILS